VSIFIGVYVRAYRVTGSGKRERISPAFIFRAVEYYETRAEPLSFRAIKDLIPQKNTIIKIAL
jgi:hypothetical protein